MVTFRTTPSLGNNEQESDYTKQPVECSADFLPIDLIRNASPDLAIVDITLKGSSGLELIKRIKAHPIGVPVLVLSMHDESLYAERALRAGATGYITKHEAADNVLLAIRRVLAGEVYLSGTMTSVFLRSFTTGLKSMPRPLDRLTDRERL